MSLSITVGVKALVQLGVSLSDIALIVRAGRTFGNWLRVKTNDEDLFEILEDVEVLLKRRGVVDTAHMERYYSSFEFIYQTGKVSGGSQQPQQADGSQASELPHSQRVAPGADNPNLRPFSWLMITIVTTLDLFMSQDRIVEFVIGLLVHVLDDPEMESSLRVSIRVNIESWRSAGRVRRMADQIKRECRSAWMKYTGCDAIPQLNPFEDHEAQQFLQCLMEDKSNTFTCYCASTLVIANSLKACGISISMDPKTFLESQLLVIYIQDGHGFHELATAPPQIQTAEMVSYRFKEPKSMIEAMKADRKTKDNMRLFWEQGAEAAARLKLVACSSDSSGAISTEVVYYELGDYNDEYSRSFPSEVLILSQKAFPVKTTEVLEAVERLLEEVRQPEVKAWLDTHAGAEYLLRGNTESLDADKRPLYLRYQSLVFGFYYRLLAPLVCADFLDSEQAYCRGVWGHDGVTFLAMCTQFGTELRTGDWRVSRTHVAYMLAAMYGGRPKVFSPGSTRHNVLGVLGPVSVLASHLLQPTDQPEGLTKFAVLGLPIVHLVPEDDGDLFASPECNIKHRAPDRVAKEIHRRSARGKWSVHSSMATVLPGGGSGVVLGARCDGRLVGWFSPTAAVKLFLSTAYIRNSVDGDNPEDGPVKGFEVTEEDFKAGVIPVPARSEGDNTLFGVVHSAGSSVFRYVAAGFYGCSGEEVAIANGNVLAAFQRLEVQERGIVIS